MLNQMMGKVHTNSSTTDRIPVTTEATNVPHRLYNLKVKGLQGTADQAKEQFIILAREHLATSLHHNEITVRLLSHTKDLYLITFSFLELRRKLWTNKLLLRDVKHCQIFISEDLEPQQSKLFFEARKLKKDRKISTAWSNEHKIFVRLKGEGQQPKEITSEQMLSNVMLSNAAPHRSIPARSLQEMTNSITLGRQLQQMIDQ
jgi:hypothetical protein